MPQCAKCKNGITDVAEASGKCPICGATLQATDVSQSAPAPSSSVADSGKAPGALTKPTGTVTVAVGEASHAGISTNKEHSLPVVAKADSAAATDRHPVPPATSVAPADGSAPSAATSVVSRGGSSAPSGGKFDGPAPDATGDVTKTIDFRKMTPRESAAWQQTILQEIQGADPTFTPLERLSLPTIIGLPTPTPRMPEGRATVASPDNSGPESQLVIQTRGFGTPSESAPGAFPPHRLDYDSIEKINEGGMGVVYKARQTSVDREVAIKMIRSDRAHDKAARASFLSEAVVIGELDHPNIIPIHDVAKNPEDVLFYSMKLVTSGNPWNHVIDKQPLQENLRILMSVADAVAFAHKHKVVHRDLKPENVMLGEFGEVLVTDWGLALVLPGAPKENSVTRTSGMGYTPAYAAPELITGPARDIGPWSDVYLLGAILYRILTGKPPHPGRSGSACTAAAIRNVIQASDKPGELVDIAMRAMAKDPGQRFASVQDFQAEVRGYQEHMQSESLSERASKDLEKARTTDDYQDYARSVFGYEEALQVWGGNKSARKGLSVAQLAYADSAFRNENYELGLTVLDAQNPDHAPVVARLVEGKRERDSRRRSLKRARQTLAALAVVFFFVVAIAAYYSNAKRLEAETAAKAADQSAIDARLAQQAAEKAAGAEREQREIAVAAAAAEATAREAAVKAAESETAAKDEAVKARDDAEMKRLAAVKASEQEAIARQEADDRRREAEQANAAQKYEAAVARVGLASEQIGVNAFDSAKDALKLVEQENRGWEWYRLKYLSEQGLGEPVVFPYEIDAVAVDSTGQRYAVAGRTLDGEIRVGPLDQLGRAGGATLKLGAAVLSLSFSPDDRLLAAGGEQGQLAVWKVGDVVDVRPVVRLEAGRKSVHRVRFVDVKVADGQTRHSWLLAACGDGRARLWDCLGGPANITKKPTQSLIEEVDPLSVWDIAMSPDGQAIVTVSDQATARIWTAEDPKNPASFKRAMVKVNEKEIPRIFRGHTGSIRAVAFHPDGKLVATAGDDRKILIWDPSQVPADNPLENKLPPDTIVIESESSHYESIQVLAFRPDGEQLLSAGDDNTVRIWNWKNRRAKPTVLRGHGGWIRSAVYNPRAGSTGDWVVISGSHDRQVKTWNVAGYAEMLRVGVMKDHRDAVLSASFSRAPNDNRDGVAIVTASRDHDCRIWRLKPDQTAAPLIQDAVSLSEGHAFSVASVVYFGDGKRVVTAGIDNQACLWDVETGVQLARFKGTGVRAAVAVSPGDRLLLTGSDRDSVKLWNVDDAIRQYAAGNEPQPAQEFRTPGNDQGARDDDVRVIAFGPATRGIFYTGHERGDGYLYQLSTGVGRKLEDGHATDSSVNGAVFLADGDRLATAADDGIVMLWDTTTGQREQSLDHAEVSRGRSDVSVIALAAAGGKLITVSQPKIRKGDGGAAAAQAGEPSLICRWNLQTGLLEEKRPLAGGARVARMAISPSRPEALLAIGYTGNDSTELWRWDLDKWSEQKISEQRHLLDASMLSRIKVWAVAYAPDGARFVTAGSNEAYVWAGAGGQQGPITRLGPHRAVASAGFSSDGRYVVTGSWDESFKIWEVGATTGRSLRRQAVAGKGAINSATFSPEPNAYRILTAHDFGAVCLWDWNPQQPGVELRPVRQFTHPAVKRVNLATFSPDGSNVVAACNGGKAIVWDLAAPADQAPLLFEGQHNGDVLSAAFSSDGNWLATGGDDKQAVIWNARRGRPFLREPLRGHSASITSVAFLGNGERLLTGSRDNTAKVWDPRIISAQKLAEADGAANDEQPVGKELLTLRGHTSEVSSVEFSPDGRFVLTGSYDNTSILWLTDKPADKP